MLYGMGALLFTHKKNHGAGASWFRNFEFLRTEET